MKQTYRQSLKARLAAATKGWKLHEGFNRFEARPSAYGIYLEFGSQGAVLVTHLKPEAVFAIHARTDVKILLHELEKVEAALRNYSDCYNCGSMNRACTANHSEARDALASLRAVLDGEQKDGE